MMRWFDVGVRMVFFFELGVRRKKSGYKLRYGKDGDITRDGIEKSVILSDIC